MKIWKRNFNIDQLNTHNIGLAKHIDIEFTSAGDDYLIARMPVDERTRQPFGLLHGGASVVLAETLGSYAGLLCVEEEDKTIVGVEINANHIRSIREGYVYGKATPIRLGRKLQVWTIEIRNEEDEITCVSRFTLAVVSTRR